MAKTLLYLGVAFGGGEVKLRPVSLSVTKDAALAKATFRAEQAVEAPRFVAVYPICEGWKLDGDLRLAVCQDLEEQGHSPDDVIKIYRDVFIPETQKAIDSYIVGYLHSSLCNAVRRAVLGEGK